MNNSRLLLNRARSTWTHRVVSSYAPQRPPRSTFKKVMNGVILTTAVTTVTVGVGGVVMYNRNDQFRHVMNALERCAIAGSVSTRVAFDYYQTLNTKYQTEDAYEEEKSKCHTRCATRVLKAIQKLGGVYVKLGQHLSVMEYMLPNEWCKTMSVLQDRCEPTSPEDVRQLFLTDYGTPMEDIFEEFEWEPLGVASLAQVHKARLRHHDNDETDGWVAVKLQHPYLEKYCKVDMDTVSFILDIVKMVFPDFGFEWFAEEMRESLPKELDFTHERDNANKVRSNFSDDISNNTHALFIPNVIWAKKRIMCMEYIDGSRMDDLDYMKKHKINPQEVSRELTRIFSEMIFIHGFVHCDPHPGNVYIRPAKYQTSKYNFDIVLLDHGLYRELSDELRSNYAHLWTALIKADEEGIKEYAHKVGGTDVYQLFACMLTGREWEKVHQNDLHSVRNNDEVGRISEGAMTYLVEVADILGKLDRTVLLLLKTNDLLRHVDEKLNSNPDERITYTIMGAYCSRAVWLDTRNYISDKMRTLGFSLHLFKQLVSAWWEYKSLEYALWIYQLTTEWMDRFHGKAKRIAL
ncbi:ABC1 family-domain-containing protein [Pilobolus umbonatus]|nr:ABC1 family-domain-containing protein [Pilobolus umbonatus]